MSEPHPLREYRGSLEWPANQSKSNPIMDIWPCSAETRAPTPGQGLRSFPGYLKWRSTIFESEDSSKQTVRSDLTYNGTIWRFDRLLLKNWRPPFEVPWKTAKVAQHRRVYTVNSVSGLESNRSFSTNQNVPMQTKKKRCTWYTLGTVIFSTSHSTTTDQDKTCQH